MGTGTGTSTGDLLPAETTPVVVTLHVWGVSTAAVPRALTRMAVDRLLLRTAPATFTRLLGTGRGRTFGLRDADPHHWALLACWPSEGAAEEFAASRTARAWQRVSSETLVARLRPLSSRGRWSGRQPFGDPTPRRTDGPVASITRARIRPTRELLFRRAVPPVAQDLHAVPGLRLAVGVGEWPVGLQGTFSLWDDAEALTRFAYRRNPHTDVIRRTGQERWYAEELFARFEVLSVTGTHGGRAP